MSRTDEQLKQIIVSNVCILEDVAVVRHLRYNGLSKQNDVHGEFLSTIDEGFRLSIGENMDTVTLHRVITLDGLMTEAIASEVLSPSHINNFGNNANDIILTSSDGYHYWYRVSASGHMILLYTKMKNILSHVSTVKLYKHVVEVPTRFGYLIDFENNVYSTPDPLDTVPLDHVQINLFASRYAWDLAYGVPVGWDYTENYSTIVYVNPGEYDYFLPTDTGVKYLVQASDAVVLSTSIQYSTRVGLLLDNKNIVLLPTGWVYSSDYYNDVYICQDSPIVFTSTNSIREIRIDQEWIHGYDKINNNGDSMIVINSWQNKPYFDINPWDIRPIIGVHFFIGDFDVIDGKYMEIFFQPKYNSIHYIYHDGMTEYGGIVKKNIEFDYNRITERLPYSTDVPYMEVINLPETLPGLDSEHIKNTNYLSTALPNLTLGRRTWVFNHVGTKLDISVTNGSALKVPIVSLDVGFNFPEMSSKVKITQTPGTRPGLFTRENYLCHGIYMNEWVGVDPNPLV
jgi:hypothetical protein